jgi:hypothetical protein
MTSLREKEDYKSYKAKLRKRNEKIMVEIMKSPLIIVWFVSLLPISLLLNLYLASLRAMQLIGHWPIAGRDDPFHIGENDHFYQFFLSSIYGDLLTVLALSLFFHFLFHSYKVLTILKLQLVVFIFSIISLLFDPTERFAWFLD